MRGHGFTTAADTLPTAVYQAVYAQTNAGIVLDAARLGGSAVGCEGLSEEEVRDTWKTNLGTQSRPWGLWEREVEAAGIYRNELKGGGEGR